MTSGSPTKITVNDIGEYVRHKSCDRRFHLTVHYDREVRPLPFFDRLLILYAVSSETSSNSWNRSVMRDASPSA